MLMKGTLAASLMAMALAFSPVSADAKTKLHIDLGIGFWPGHCYAYNDDGYCGPRWGYYRYGRYWDDPPPRRRYHEANVSCGEARDILRDRGYRRISSRDCSGRTYVFTAVKRGNLYRIAIRSWNGEVVSVERI